MSPDCSTTALQLFWMSSLCILHLFIWFLKVLLRKISLRVESWDPFEFYINLVNKNTACKMTIQQLNPQVMIYLTSSRKWDNWFSVAKAYSLGLKIWNYINSDNLEECILPTELSRSAVLQAKLGATIIVDLEDDELTQYNYLHKNWKKKKTVYGKTK